MRGDGVQLLGEVLNLDHKVESCVFGSPNPIVQKGLPAMGNDTRCKNLINSLRLILDEWSPSGVAELGLFIRGWESCLSNMGRNLCVFRGFS